ncbi:MAG: hypothetical protein CM1200mP20_06900 [Pseudomonadota bacterium]|nr:MAG: hypothetical protein CM1200mP20_06900 [Pseudomonadota bacterium]
MARWSTQRKKRHGLHALQWLLRPVSDFYLRSDDCHVYSVFSGRRGGTSFPMRGASFYWWQKLIEPSTVGDMQGAFTLFDSGFNRDGDHGCFFDYAGDGVPKTIHRFKFTVLYGHVWAEGFRVSSESGAGDSSQADRHASGLVVFWSRRPRGLAPAIGFLVMMAVFNRFDTSLEEAARDMGADEWTVSKK